MDISQEQLKNIVKEAIQEAIPEEPKATLTINECAKVTGIGRDKLLELVHSTSSDFPSFRVGSKFLINREMLRNWLEKISKERKIL